MLLSIYNMNRKSLSVFLFVIIIALPFHVLASERKDTVSVAGVCESCKARIEKAAKQAGATYANWNAKTHVLEVNYNDSVTSLMALEKKIAFAGHDTRDVKATIAAYNQLPSCCQYNRSGATDAKKICEDDKKQ